MQHSTAQLKKVDILHYVTHFQKFSVWVITFACCLDMHRLVRSKWPRGHYGVCSHVCRWLALRLEFLGGIVVLGAAIFAVVEKGHGGATQASLVGLSVSYALMVRVRRLDCPRRLMFCCSFSF